MGVDEVGVNEMGSRRSGTTPLNQTLTDFLLKCKILETVRKPILDKFNTVLRGIITVFPDAANYTLVQLLVDCGVLLQNCQEYIHTNIISLIDLLHYHSRRLVYTLHVTRFSQLPVTAKCTKNRKGTVRHIHVISPDLVGISIF